MKAILSPAGLILIAFLLFVVFFPRRPPDVRKPLRKRMRAFPEDPAAGHDDADSAAADDDHTGDAPDAG